ncbi:MAG: hypothetical protein WCH05_06610 [Chlorobiaceae bacterium]
MFIGSVPPEVRLLFQDLVRGTGSKEFYIGCSGNFSVDKVIARMGLNVHSNDVSLYSKLVADIVLGTDTALEVTQEELRHVFAIWPETRYKKLIQVMFAMRLSKFAAQKNDYQKTFYEVMMTDAPRYYENTVSKLEKGAFDFSIKSFYFGDFRDFLDLPKKKEGGVGISFPPTYKAGYEKIYDYVEKSFDYERPKYEIFDPKTAEALYGKLLREDQNIFCSDQDFQTLGDYKKGVVRLGSGRHSLYVYSSVKGPQCHYFERSRKEFVNGIDLLASDIVLDRTAKVTVKVCRADQITYFKHLFMSARVNYSAGGDFGLIFFADKKAFGFAAFSKMMSTMEMCYLHSDFVVPSHTTRLSKLVLYLLKAKEVRRLIARKLSHYYEGLRTTVYTDKAVSMKYRGVFELDRRDKGKLMYQCRFNEETLDEAFQQWFRKKKGK